jgi:hypothetical protein
MICMGWMKASANKSYSNTMDLQSCALYRWLKLLGFNYEAECKGYYVDGHEKPDTVTYQKDFVKKYLMEEG